MMLSERQAQLLDFIVRQYVRTAEPVGSAVISTRADLDVSPATIRNEMQTLEEEGYLSQPHTSAGRIPTDKAYRHFVNGLLEHEGYSVDAKAKRQVHDAVQAGGENPHEINKNLANVLTGLLNSMVITTIEETDDFYKTGLSSLFESPEFREIDRMSEFVNFFDRFDTLFARIERDVLSHCERGTRFQVLIGHENPFQRIQGETTIWARYPLPDGRTGSLTIIGPTRMDYPRNIGLISYATDFMERMFED